MGALVKFGYLVGLCLTALNLWAATTEQVFQQAEVVSEKQEEDRHYLLPLGRVKHDRSLGRDLPAEYKRLDGEFASVVWELTGNQTIEEAKARVQDFVDSPRFDLLFACFNRDCGESFAWANSVFDEALLYGNDRSQSLWVVKDKGERRYHVFYLIQRPNRRTYFYEETLYVPDLELDESVIQDLLKSQGYLVLGEVAFREGVPDFNPVIEKLAPYVGAIPPKLLVLHRHNGALQYSDLAQKLKQTLSEKGIEVDVEDVANRSPRASAPGNAWVEWVNPDWKP